jgi:antitoxin CcdA
MNIQRKLGNAVKRATNVSLPSDLIEEARSLNVNISKACEAGLQEQVARSRADRWREENRSAIQYWNRWVEENGLPLEEYSQF